MPSTSYALSHHILTKHLWSEFYDDLFYRELRFTSAQRHTNNTRQNWSWTWSVSPLSLYTYSLCLIWVVINTTFMITVCFTKWHIISNVKKSYSSCNFGCLATPLISASLAVKWDWTKNKVLWKKILLLKLNKENLLLKILNCSWNKH